MGSRFAAHPKNETPAGPLLQMSFMLWYGGIPPISLPVPPTPPYSLVNHHLPLMPSSRLCKLYKNGKSLSIISTLRISCGPSGPSHKMPLSTPWIEYIYIQFILLQSTQHTTLTNSQTNNTQNSNKTNYVDTPQYYAPIF